MVHRIFSCTYLLTWALLSWSCEGKDSPSGPAITDGGSGQVVCDTLFTDRGLEAAVRTALNRPKGEITPNVLSSLKSLDAHGLGIKDLSGIEQLDSLQSLDLADNEVIDLTPLAALVRLEYLDLDHNQVTEVSALVSLMQLKVLILERNAVQDLSPLQDLSHLERLELTEGMADPSATVCLEARGVEVVWALIEESPSPGGGGYYPPPVGAGPRIAFSMPKVSNTNDADIWVMATDGSGLTDLICSEVDETQPVWSPDGTQLAYVTGPPGLRDIYVLRSGVRDPVCLAQDPGRDEYSPSWASDGHRITYVCDDDIWTMKADGSEQANLTQHPAKDWDSSWSPDGQSITFASTRDAGVLNEESDIFVMAANGGNVVNLTNNPSKSRAPCFSPDGTRIVFLSNRDRIGSVPDPNGVLAILATHCLDIWTMSADGSDSQNLSGSWWEMKYMAWGDDQPSWSPDGRRIIFSYHSHVWTMALDGSDRSILLLFVNASHPTWVADAAMDLAGIEE